VSIQERAHEHIIARFGDDVVEQGEHAGQKWASVRRERIIEALTSLRDELGFEVLMDLTAVDWLDCGKPERFCVVYNLYSLKDNGFYRLKTWVPEGDEQVDTASGLWKSANWAEREVYDMFGLTFRGHPDLRRILLPFEYKGHPLRKEYPLVGEGERFQFPKYQR
jgi:NADH-quinone oxidoreductase subunit C